jgi:HPt (histidine-containing phosphotransfer) domain-containing protein
VADERLRQETDEAGRPAGEAPGPARPGGALDWEAMLDRLGGDPNLLREVARMFLAEAPQVLAQVRAAIAAGDADGLRRAAHTLRGSAGVFAAWNVERLAGQLEEVGSSGRMAEAPAALAALAAELHGFLASLADLLPNCG